MLQKNLAVLFERDLGRLRTEIKAFQPEAGLWEERPGITNPPGNLCLHICGNLQHFIGAVLGNSGYMRDRQAEFSTRGQSKEELLALIGLTEKAVAASLEKVSDEALQQPYPIELFGHPMTTGYFLIHLIGHLNYHLGQINYFRRLTPDS